MLKDLPSEHVRMTSTPFYYLVLHVFLVQKNVPQLIPASHSANLIHPEFSQLWMVEVNHSKETFMCQTKSRKLSETK